LILAAALSVSPTGSVSAVEPGKAFTLDASAVPGAKLRICLSATSSRVRVSRSALPWGNRYSLVLVAIPLASKSQAPMGQTLDIDDPVFGQFVDIEVGKPTCGEIDLATRFPALEKENKSQDIGLFWLYSFSTEKGRVERYGGFVPLPQR
jgi:hypothetical protein